MSFKLIIQIFKNKSYNYLNVAGLALAFGVFIIVSLYVYNEFQGDKFHQNYKNIARLNRTTKVGTPIPITNHFKDKFPEIQKYARINRMYDPIVKNNEQLIKLKTGYFSDKSAFDVFSFDLLYGTIGDDFVTPFSISISESLSNKLFGEVNPVGEIVKYNNEFNFTVKAVFKDLPSNSHLEVDALASIESMGSMTELEKYPYESFSRWGCMNYLLLSPNASIPQLEKKLSSLIKEVMNDEKFEFGLQPFSEIYFDGNRSMDDCKHSNKQTLLILLSIACIIIVLACVNYINLSTAQIFSRSNEIGVKKMLGASKLSLIQRFIKESVLISMLSMIAGFFIAYLLSLLFSNLLPNALFAKNIFSIGPILMYIFLSMIIGLLAGFYPAVYYSTAKELNILKGINRNVKGQGVLRKGLIIVQFAASIILIIGTLFVYKQLYLFKNIDPGFPKEQLMYLAYNDLGSSSKMNSFLEEISQNSNIKSITQSNTIPGNIFSQNINRIENEDKILYDLAATREYFETMDLKMIEGKLPSVNPEKRKNELVLNQTAVEMLEWKEPVGRTDIWGREVVGVVEDFNYMSMHHAILPLMIRFDTYYSYATLRINTQNLNQTISMVESKWIQFFPSSMFEYHFLDDSFGQLYQSEIKFGKLAIYLSFIAIFVSLLGMAGLVSFVTKRRIKEIGVRKVNGAKVSEILIMLNKDFIKWVAIAFIVACPIAYYAMNKWLENFAYKTTLSWWIFVLAGVLALGIALLTVSWQSWRAATRNPVEALRYE